jgi:hypothetical protein
LKMAKMNLWENLRKEIQKKIEKGKGALAGRGLASGPLAEAGLARPRLPLPPPRARARVRARGRPRRAAVARRQSLAAAWRACGGVETPWSATRSPWTRPPKPPLPFAPSTARSRLSARPRAALAAPPHAIAADGSELPSRPAPALSFPFATTTGSASSFRVSCLRSSALGKPCVPARAHRSESELRRPLGSHGSPSPLCLCSRS